VSVGIWVYVVFDIHSVAADDFQFWNKFLCRYVNMELVKYELDAQLLGNLFRYFA
jgi:hypothetical protein